MFFLFCSFPDNLHAVGPIEYCNYRTNKYLSPPDYTHAEVQISSVNTNPLDIDLNQPSNDMNMLIQ